MKPAFSNLERVTRFFLRSGWTSSLRGSKRSTLRSTLNSDDRLRTSGALEKMRIPGSEANVRPVLLICETVNVCNQDCVFCPYSQQTRAKGIMPMDLFERVVSQYAEMGGGILSVTPMVGDILLDRHLLSRIEILNRAKPVVTPTVTTNLVGLKRYTDEQVVSLIRTFKRIHISCYGLSPSENLAITRRDHYQKFADSAKRFMQLWESTGESRCELKLGFRNMFEHTQESLESFSATVFGRVLPFSAIHSYANWGNRMTGVLPGDAEWMEAKQNSTPCVLLAAAMQVYWDGRVTSCACCDYDASDELALGNLYEEDLVSLYNGERSQSLWRAHTTNMLPEICRNCTFHLPLNDLHPEHSLVANPVEFIGG